MAEQHATPLSRIVKPVRGRHKIGSKPGIEAHRQEPWIAEQVVTPALKIGVRQPARWIAARDAATVLRLERWTAAAIGAVAPVEIAWVTAASRVTVRAATTEAPLAEIETAEAQPAPAVHVDPRVLAVEVVAVAAVAAVDGADNAR